MKSTFGLTAVFAFPLLAHTAWRLTCEKDEYPLENSKCCKYCPPGEQIAARCTSAAGTICEPCEENYYKDDSAFVRADCKRCTVCDKGRGLREEQPCNKKANTVCVCLPGYAPANGVFSKDEKRCDPCPNGYFSKGGKEKCQPWTNCTANGWKTLRAGKREGDAICHEQPTKLPGRTSATFPSSQRKGHGAPTTKPSFTQVNLATALKKDEPKQNDHDLLLIILIGGGLLLGVGGPVLLLFFRNAKKKKEQMRSEIFSCVPHEDGSSSYRIPIQEEQVDCKSSLARN